MERRARERAEAAEHQASSATATRRRIIVAFCTIIVLVAAVAVAAGDAQWLALSAVVALVGGVGLSSALRSP